MNITICKPKEQPKRRFRREKVNKMEKKIVIRKVTLPGLQQVITDAMSYIEIIPSWKWKELGGPMT